MQIIHFHVIYAAPFPRPFSPSWRRKTGQNRKRRRRRVNQRKGRTSQSNRKRVVRRQYNATYAYFRTFDTFQMKNTASKNSGRILNQWNGIDDLLIKQHSTCTAKQKFRYLFNYKQTINMYKLYTMEYVFLMIWIASCVI